MKIEPLPGSHAIPLPVPLYTATPIAKAASDDGSAFLIYLGLDEPLVAKLRERSLDPNDPDLDRYTSDRKRFGEGSYEIWYGQRRTPFALVSAEGELAALAWFGPKPLGRKSLKHASPAETEALESLGTKTDWHTLSFRAYPKFRGKKLMKDFVRFAMEEYERAMPRAKLWTITSKENAGSVALATKLGFEVEAEDKAFITMVKK